MFVLEVGPPLVEVRTTKKQSTGRIFVKHRVWAALALLALCPNVADANELQPVGLELGSGADPYAPAVARMVRSIAEFTSWQGDDRRIRLCILGPTDHADEIVEAPLSGGRRLVPVRYANPAASIADCEAIYIGRMSLEDQRRIAGQAMGRDVLTIAENDPACRSHAMFCLLFQANSLSFRLDTDAVSRSGVRVDPRVLRLQYSGKDRG